MRIVGIDLGASAVKAVAIEATFRSHSVSGYRCETVPPAEIPPEGEKPKTYLERAQSALEAVGKDGWLKADKVVCTLPAATVAAHAITLPFSDRKQVDAILPGEIEALIPFDPADIVFDSIQLSRVPGKTELFVAIAQRAQVQSVLALLQAAGADPAIVTFSALSLANLFSENYIAAAPPANPGEPAPLEALIDIGDERTNIFISQGGEVRFARSVPQGGSAITAALARSVEVPLATAEQMKQSVDLSGGGEPTFTKVAERAVSALVREARATFGGYAARTKQKITRVRLTGGGSHLGGIAGFFSTALGMPVEPLTLKPNASVTEKIETAQIDRAALALGLALRGLDSSKSPKLNFRRGSLAYTQDVGHTQGLYRGLAAMAALVMVLFGVSVWARVHALEAREAQLDKTLCDATKKILGKCETDYRVALGKLSGSSSGTGDVPQISAVDLVVSIGELFPEGDDTTLEDLDIIDGAIRMRGTSKTYEAVDDLANNLTKDKCFTDVKKGKLEKNIGGSVDFSMDVTYGCSGVAKDSI